MSYKPLLHIPPQLWWFFRTRLCHRFYLLLILYYVLVCTLSHSRMRYRSRSRMTYLTPSKPIISLNWPLPSSLPSPIPVQQQRALLRRHRRPYDSRGLLPLSQLPTSRAHGRLLASESTIERGEFALFTVVENGKKHRQNSHLTIHCPTSEGTSERTSEWPNTSLFSWLLSTKVRFVYKSFDSKRVYLAMEEMTLLYSWFDGESRGLTYIHRHVISTYFVSCHDGGKRVSIARGKHVFFSRWPKIYYPRNQAWLFFRRGSGVYRREVYGFTMVA